MYIFIKIHDEMGNGNKPTIIEETNIEKALDIICEKYYGIKFTKIMSVIHYPKFLQVLETIRGL